MALELIKAVAFLARHFPQLLGDLLCGLRVFARVLGCSLQ